MQKRATRTLEDPSAAERAALGLDRLAPGERGRVESLDAAEPLATRLADLGFCPGTLVRVLRRAPLGDPVLYELRGYRIALRRGEAGRIRVTRESGGREAAPG